MQPVVVAIAAGQQRLVDAFVDAARRLAPDLPIFVVSEFAPREGAWIPYRLERTVEDNLARLMAELGDRKIDLCAVLEQPDTPYHALHQLAGRLSSERLVLFNPDLRHYFFRPPSALDAARYKRWRWLSSLERQFAPGGRAYAVGRLLRGPESLRRPLIYRIAKRRSAPQRPASPLPQLAKLPAGVSVAIPSRSGRHLLERCLPPVIAQAPEQVIVVDNGSTDATANWLREAFPSIDVVHSATPLSFSSAINRGLERVAFRHVCLLNNDMEVEPGFLAALSATLTSDAALFCATPQIFFPEGVRREETGKAVMPPGLGPFDFPIACVEPVEGEGRTPVLYGSGGCSLYDTAKLRAIGGFDESFTPAYVEDLDAGFRGWQHGWPTVFVPEARVLHRHRSTTSRYFTNTQIQSAVECNYLRFLLRNIAAPEPFRRLWNAAVDRVNLLASTSPEPASYFEALRFAAAARIPPRPSPRAIADEDIFALGSGEIARFEGRQRSAKPTVVIASCYAPFPLSHGGAVRMYNLMRRGANDFRQVLVYFTDELAAPPQDLLNICAEVIQVRRRHSHSYSRADLPDVVQDFQSPAMAAVLRRLNASILQLEFTQLAQYAGCCPGAKSILVEHDVTVDLYRQLAESSTGGNRWELERQLLLWESFEREAWTQCDRVVVMSERDRSTAGARAVVLPNGVDLERYRPATETPEAGRLLFIGSFAHLPNLLALQFFVDGVLPHLPDATFHVIAGNRPEYYREFYRDRVLLDLRHPRIELEAFVSDVRPAYRRAEIVVAPLIASAGTNIKILEAIAMGRPIVSTPAGIHGLDLAHGRDVIVVQTAEEMAAAIRELLANPALRARLVAAAYETVRARYDWDRIAERQRELYNTLLAEIA